MVEAGGETVLNWKQALDAAIERFQKVEKPGFLEAADLTVQTAVDEYSAMRDARDSARDGRPIRSDGRSRLTRYVKVDEKLAGIRLHELTESDLRAWRGQLHGLKILTQQRLANDLKAALNHCYMNHRRSLPTDFPMRAPGTHAQGRASVVVRRAAAHPSVRGPASAEPPDERATFLVQAGPSATAPHSPPPPADPPRPPPPLLSGALRRRRRAR
jgi:hypothetical protein